MAKTQLISDQNYLPEVLRLIGKAKKSIDIVSFSFAIGSATGKHATWSAPFKIAEKLKSAQKKHHDHLKIRFFTEGFRETSSRNKVTAQYLKAAGVHIKLGATHAKGFCIDGRYILFGSTNLTNQSIMKNHEANLLIDNPKIAQEFTRYTDHLWNGGKHGGITLNPPFAADGDFKDQLITMINNAKKRIEFSIYFFNHKEIEQALIKAHQRNVKITGFIHRHQSFALPFIWANRSTVKRLNASGIKDIYWGRPYLFSHAKYLIADGKHIALGTGNWLAQDVKIHPQLYIFLENKNLALELNKHLKKQIKEAKKVKGDKVVAFN